jgi:hypothetical protein
VELLSVYGWVILIMLIVLIIAYYSGYLNVINMLPPYCDFTPTMSCSTFKFGYAQDGTTMALNYKLTNGLGYDIVFGTNAAVLTVENVGKLGRNNYTGNCTSTESPVRQGDKISCTILIPDKDVIPTGSRKVDFKVAVTYGNCNVAPNYTKNGDCAGAPNYTVSGLIRTPLETNVTALYGCGSGVCDYALGEDPSKCCPDCPISNLIAVANPSSVPNGDPVRVDVTATYGDGSPTPNATITFSANATPPFNVFSPAQGLTNATGQVSTVYKGKMIPFTVPVNISINVTSPCGGKTLNVTVTLVG